MRTVEAISVTSRAATVLQHELEACKPSHGGVVALVYIASFVNKDGSPVRGFAPGYMVGPLERRYLYDQWIHARPRGLPEFYIDLRAEWSGVGGLVIDLAATTYAMFSVSPEQ
jgi:hypothetical protein